MLKNFYIISFIMVFLLSTTGLPLTLHLCSMQESSVLESCDMCAEKPVEVKTCCSEDYDEEIITISKSADTCCETKLVDKKVSDEFCTKTEFRDITLSLVSFLNVSGTVLTAPEINHTNFEFPPLLPGSGKIYLNISLLLI